METNKLIGLLKTYLEKGEMGACSHLTILDDGSGELVNLDSWDDLEDKFTVFTFDTLEELEKELTSGHAYLDLE